MTCLYTYTTLMPPETLSLSFSVSQTHRLIGKLGISLLIKKKKQANTACFKVLDIFEIIKMNHSTK